MKIKFSNIFHQPQPYKIDFRFQLFLKIAGILPRATRGAWPAVQALREEVTHVRRVLSEQTRIGIHCI